MSAPATRRGRVIALALAAPMLLLVTACGSDDAAEQPTAEVAEDETVGDLLGQDDTLSGVAALVQGTGMNEVLAAEPNYTLLAPTNEALSALSGSEDEGDTAAKAALLRAHLLPGYVTLDDIKAAIAASEGGTVTMQTMAQTPVTFTSEGDAVMVASEDGASATISGTGLRGGNGVILPVNAVLKSL